MKLKFYITIIISILQFTLVAQEVQLKAKVSKNKLGVNQRLRVEFSINKQGGDNFTPPKFTNFKIVGGPSQSVSQSWINGKVSFTQSYTYILQPKRKGEFNLPSASIEFNGNIIKSDAVKVVVLDAVAIPKNPNDPNYVAQQNIHLVAQLSKANPYVGEGIYVEYRLYVSENVSIYDFTETELPKYKGFWNQDVKLKNMSVKMGKYNGEDYRYVVLKKSLLIPTKEGKLSIDPMKMDVLVGVPTGRADFFGNIMSKQVRKEFVSTKKTVHVKSLPVANKPINFNGAVGQYSFAIALNKNTLKANESAQIELKIQGEGNLKLFELPKVITPEELEVYQPERKEKVSVTSRGLKGYITENYTVVPQYKGKYKIPKVNFSYFNPKTKNYQTITSNDLYVDVLEGKEIATSATTTNTAKQNVVLTGSDFRYIQTTSNFTTGTSTDFFKSTWYYILLLLPFASIPVALFLHNKSEARKKDVLGNKQRKATRLAKKYLSQAQKELGNKEAFYEALEKALHNYLKAKLGVTTTDISKEKISVLLKNKQVDTADINNFIAVLNDCEFARYTPITNTQMHQEYEKAIQVITQLDKQL